ncbi:putative polyketide synthase [Ophiocordyceps camponoti-floridani]|uniref:Putative polyketide synthase n=1 Tax=Ophiocordyceps camponoti-floridani TaxID=2030778 RepID=A0A8H4QE06_9HYPO|nr:putative polyketide synthase [Ophiocordyceps camponoti-floridani]
MSLQKPIEEPIAVVGVACRFPGGANSPSKLWDLLCEKRDVQQTISRFNVDGFYDDNGEKSGCTNAKKAYLLSEDIRLFDAAFFRTSPHEAESMDPQQRILLETVYEATEDAGIPLKPDGSNVAVYVGNMTGDYHEMLLRDPQHLPKYMATGTARSILSNRVSYFFNWKGPSVTIDTACSSSLVAVHEAVTTLRLGVSDVACAAGTNLILGPEMMISESKLHMLSPTGRSNMWSASADGYARGEGVAAVILKTLSRALKDGDHIHALIRATGVNSDGRTSGITLPSSESQKELIRRTYANAGLDYSSDAGRCQFFEAHGTGTPAGDPIEARAIHEAFFDDSKGNPEAMILVGSIKTAIGHLEGCAGLAGLIKAVEAVRRGVVPPNLHFDKLNPAIVPYSNHLKIVTDVLPWPELPPNTPRRVSVNSFGFGGTNAHAIVENFQDNTTDKRLLGERIVTPLVVSANSEHSLRGLVDALRERLGAMDDDEELGRILFTLAERRTQLPLRATFSAHSVQALRKRLEEATTSASDAEPMAFLQDVRQPGQRGRIMGVFTGQGAQWPTMGRELLRESAFARSLMTKLEESLAALPEPPAWRLTEQCIADADASRLGEAAVSQPLCTAIQLIVVELLRRAGVRFSCVVGHSSGEIAAAYAAGFISVEDAIRIAYCRGVCAGLARGSDGQRGAMMAAGLPYDEAVNLCSERFPGRLSVAASNSPSGVTLSGDQDAVDEAVALLQQRGIFTRILKVDTAYHSSHMVPCAGPYLSLLEACKIRPMAGDPSCEWYSSVIGQRMDGSRHADLLSAEYWKENMIKPVFFTQAIELAAKMSVPPCHVALEVGPHPALKGPFGQTIKQTLGAQLPYQATLVRGVDDVEALSNTLGFLWSCLGSDAVDMVSYAEAFSSAIITRSLATDIPSYQWDHTQSFWREPAKSVRYRLRKHPPHPLLGVRSTEDSAHEFRWLNTLRLSDLPWLEGHKVEQQVIYPAAGYLVMAMEAAKALDESTHVRHVELYDVSISSAVHLSYDSAGVDTLFTLRLRERQAELRIAQWACYSSPATVDNGWKCNASGWLRVEFGSPPAAKSALLPPRNIAACSLNAVDMERFYTCLRGIGLDYTGEFKHLHGVRRRSGMATAKAMYKAPRFPAMIHPALLDSAFQTLFAAYCWPDDGSLQVPFVPTSLRSLKLINMNELPGGEQLDIDAYLTNSRDRDLAADIDVFTASSGRPLMQLQGLTCTSLRKLGPRDYKELYTQTVWELDIDSGVASLENARSDNPEDLELVDLCERLAYFYLRDLRRQVAPEEVAVMDWNFKRIFEWIDEELFPAIEAGRHPTIRKEWLADNRSWLMDQATKFGPQVDLLLLQAVGDNLAAVVRKETTMLEHMIKDDVLNRFYKSGLGFQKANGYLSRIAKQIAHCRPRMNILEIGAGTGGATKGILESLGTTFESYTFTDISPGFFEAAADAFAPWASKMTFKTLDIEKDSASQDFSAGYDLIIASNVLHATESLSNTLRNVRRLLKPEGRLLLLEVTSDIVRVKFMMSGLPGWWLGGNDGRRYGPTISVSRWHSELLSAGFSGVDHALRDFSDHRYMNSVMVSQAVDETSRVLCQPLSNSGGWLSGHTVTIIGGECSGIARNISKTLHLAAKSPSDVVVKVVERFEQMPSDLPPMRTVLVLEDLDDPLFRAMTSEKLAALQRTMNEARQVLWVSRGCRKEEAYASMSIGLCRSLAAEFPHVQIQHIDIEESDVSMPVVSYRVSEALARLIFKSTLKQPPPTESELTLENGKWLIPRILPDGPLNDQLNASKMMVKTQSSLAHETIDIYRSKGEFIVAKPTPSLLDVQSAGTGDISIHVALMAVTPLRVDDDTPAFLSYGFKAGDACSPVLAVSSTCSSRIYVPEHCVLDCSGLDVSDPPKLLRKALVAVAATQVLAGVPPGATVIQHEADQSLGAAVQWKAAEMGVKCVSTTFTASEQQDCGKSGPIRIHPKTPERDLKKLFPGDTTLLIDYSSAGKAADLEESSLRRCLPTRSKFTASQDIFGDDDMTAKQPSIVASKQIKDTLQSGLDFEVSDVERIITVSDLPGRAILDTPYTTIVDFASASPVATTLRPLDGSLLFRPDKTYLMVGCTGGLGQSLCRWMVSNGVRNLALTTRNMARLDSGWLEELRFQGATVRLFEVDVSDKDALAAVHAQIVRKMPPICGVAHAAMVLSDRSFGELTSDDFEAVLGPKVRGTQHLHDIFLDQQLDFFILFSSLASIVGNRGQSNYSAANLFMTAVAEQRRARGLAASVMHIGMVLGVGYVSSNGTHEATLRQYNYMPISEPEFLNMFAQAILVGQPTSGHSPEIISGLNRYSLQPDGQRFFWSENQRFCHHVLEEQSQEICTGENMTFSQRLVEAQSPEEMLSVVQEGFCSKLERMLQAEAGTIRISQALINLGVDSLIAAEIRSWFLKELEVDMPVLSILNTTSIADLCLEAVCRVSETPGSRDAQANKMTVLTEKSPDPGYDGSVAAGSSTEASPIDVSSESNGFGSSASSVGGDTDCSAFATERPKLERTGRLSFAQERVWFMQQLLHGQTAYNVTLMYRIKGPLRLSELERAFHAVIRRHEALRSCFFVDPETALPAQGVCHNSIFALEEKTHVSSTAEEEFKRIQESLYDLEHGPILRAVIHRSAGHNEHTLVLGFPHIALDGFSAQILMRDLALAYSGQELPRMPNSYLDYAAEERVAQIPVEKLGYWKSEFETLPAVLPLFDFAECRARVPLTEYRTRTMERTLPSSISDSIKTEARELGATPFHVYLAALQTLLFEMTSTSDICIGVVDANKTAAAYMDTIGFFVNLLPLRFQRHASQTMSDLVKEAKTKADEALAHGVPFDVLLEELKLPRSSTYSPLIQVMLNFKMGSTRSAPIGDCQAELLGFKDADNPYDLVFDVESFQDGSTWISIKTQQYLYTDHELELVMKTFVRILTSFSEKPWRDTTNITEPGPDERRKTLELGRGARIPPPKFSTISDCFRNRAASQPDAMAVTDDGGASLSYANLNSMVASIAAALKQTGLRLGARICVYCEPSVRIIACFLAIAQVGGAYVPLDSQAPAQRLQLILDDCEPDVIIFDKTSSVASLRTEARLLDIEDIQETSVSPADGESQAQESGTAFIVYTSGTSGIPKGVKITHRNLIQHSDAVVEFYGLRRGIMLQQAPLGFDLSLSQMTLSIVTGGTLLVASNATRRDPARLARLMRSGRVTQTIMTPTQALALVHHGRGELMQCTDWVFSLLSGERLRRHVVSEFRRLGMSALKLHNGYGPTEISINCSGGVDELSVTAPCDTVDPTIGVTLPNYTCYILDDELRPVGTGLAGELFVGGCGVAAGYLGRPELTESRFLADPFASASDLAQGWSWMYRTGDKAKLLPDGRIVFLGRITGDSQIKLRGFRIELQDVATNIVKASNGAISDAAVSLRKGPVADQDDGFLVAFVVLSDTACSEEEPEEYLRRLLRDLTLSLPQYMIPSVMGPVDELPVNSSGKLDRHALDALPLPRTVEPDESEPLTTTQERLKAVWLEALPMETHIGRETDFFEAGGNSLRLVALREHVARRFGVSLSVLELFQWSTLAGMASKIDSSTESPERRGPIDWSAETRVETTSLDWPTVSRQVRPAFDVAEGLEVVLTGATGFLGSAILKQLLQDRRVKHVHCLAVRDDAKAAEQQASLASDRVTYYDGDLALPRLGLSQQVFEELSRKAHRIIHNGADVSLLKSYRSLQKANVESTREMALLAAPRQVPLHFVSSGGIASLAGVEALPQMSLSDVRPPVDGSQGYAASKWASEVFLEGYTREVGTPTWIHRPANITGADAPSTDLMQNLIAYSSKTGALPDVGSWRGSVDLVPVEVVSEGIVRTIHEGGSSGNTVFLHHCAAKKIAVDELAAWLGVETVELDEWLERASGAGLDETASLLIRGMLERGAGGVVPCLLGAERAL